MSTTRWNEILTVLRAEIESGARKPGDKLPSETEIAAAFQVCRMTAHRAMSELTREGWVTRKRRAGTVVAERGAEEAAGLLIASAGSVAARPATRHVALLCFHSSDFPQADYVHGFRAGLHDDYHVLLCDTRNDAGCEAAYLRRLQDEADAICLFPTCAPENDALLREIIAGGAPLVFLDRVPDGVSGLPVAGVMTDNAASAREALGRMARERGHRRIAFFTADNPRVSSVRERLDGYAGAMQDAGVADGESLVRAFPPDAGYAFDAFVDAVGETLADLLAHPNPPTAIFCLEDYYLAATLEACERLHLSVPDDIEVIAFNDSPPLSPRPARRVHRIVQQSRLIGRLAAEQAQHRLSGGGADKDEPRVLRVPARIHLLGDNFGDNHDAPALRSTPPSVSLSRTSVGRRGKTASPKVTGKP